MIQRLVSQYAPQIGQHDAVGNEIFAIRQVLAELGISSQVFCERSEPGLPGEVLRWSGKLAEKSALTIVHYSHGAPSHKRVFSSHEPKLLLYHNITPAKFFQGTHPNLTRSSESGRDFLAALAPKVDFAAAHSRFSAAELAEFGFRNTEVLPYIILDSLYETPPDLDVLRRYRGDGAVNLISVAQVAPHKCLEDCILIFDYFKRHLNRHSRLFIVGGWAGTEAYLIRLRRLIEALNLEGVIFTGRVTQSALIAYYRIADAFLCMSEHEGFCVPLVEAIRFDVPVFAYASTAVPETLRHSGVLFEKKNWPAIAEAVGIVLTEPRWREQVLAEQHGQLSFYSTEASRERLRALLIRLNLSSLFS